MLRASSVSRMAMRTKTPQLRTKLELALVACLLHTAANASI
jgi:hypothetical protein